MDVPLNVDVECADGLCGRSTYIVMNPVTREVTHVVVQPKGSMEGDGGDHLVPVELIAESTPRFISLRCSAAEFAAMKAFTQVEFVPSSDYPPGVMLWPYAEPLIPVPVVHQRIPSGELAINRGDDVYATDGRTGHVDELLVDAANGHLTHLVMREGHLWDRKVVTIPLSEIERIGEGAVYLKLDKKAIEALPAIPLRERARG